MDWEQLSQILEPVHDIIASTRATAIELRQHGVREPQLMAQLHKLANELDADAGFVGGAGARRDDDGLRRHPADVRDRHGVIPYNLRRTPQLGQIPGQVVDEAVVVVDQ